MLSPETMEPTTEETDLLSRSSKKVKVGDNNNHADGDTRQGLSREGKGGISYRDSLMGSPYLCHNTSDESLLVDCISEDEDDDCDEEDCPVIRLSVEEKKRIRAPWRQTLIIKIMGRKVGYMYLHKRLKTPCKLQGDPSLVDLGNEFFLSKFSNNEDKEHVLFEGPWMDADHYLTIRTWHPNFDPYVATIDKVAMGVRLPDLAMEYYDNSVLWNIGNKFGKTFKVDRNTCLA